ncbi:hypothetical protein [Holospora undulata]|uniref:Uncharacterized protein n=1 Tax=Holospora undulata HU1 TaxID=1321371 RepID=A0A061JIY7_9PROT|nr:hypothetical protein [Holospora undulata]ETZ05384.1 hypothetical protein K737_300174 [Holospora undulata HU1]
MKKIKSFILGVIFFEVASSVYAKSPEKSIPIAPNQSNRYEQNTQTQIIRPRGEDGIPSHKSTKFGDGEEKFWEKDYSNMSKEITWSEFEDKKTEIKFPEYSFENDNGEKKNFIKVPGHREGLSLWHHLGIVPEDMIGIMSEYISELQKKILNSQDDYDSVAECLDVLQKLDPFEQFRKIEETEFDLFKEFTYLAENSKSVIDEWSGLVKADGGQTFSLPNGDAFFKIVSQHLKTNIAIFTEDFLNFSDSPQKNRFFKCEGAQHWLYLMQQGSGAQYDILVEKNQSISKAIMEEMYLYLNNH